MPGLVVSNDVFRRRRSSSSTLHHITHPYTPIPRGMLVSRFRAVQG